MRSLPCMGLEARESNAPSRPVARRPVRTERQSMPCVAYADRMSEAVAVVRVRGHAKYFQSISELLRFGKVWPKQPAPRSYSYLVPARRSPRGEIDCSIIRIGGKSNGGVIESPARNAGRRVFH
jgi:hypothetical protein